MAKSDNVDMEVGSLESMKKRMDDQDAKIVEQKRIIFDQKNKLEVINEDQGKVQAEKEPKKIPEGEERTGIVQIILYG